MRIMKHGNQLYYREVEHKCDTCECVFRFNLSDIMYKIDYDSDTDKFTPCNYVLCPECKSVYLLNQEEDSPTPDPDPDPTPDPEPTPDP